MKLKKIKEILGEDVEGMSDEELLELGKMTEMLVNMSIDQWRKMPLEERKKWTKKGNKKKAIDS